MKTNRQESTQRTKCKVQFTRRLKVILLFVFFVSFDFSGISQNIGINSTGATPNPSALLDVGAALSAGNGVDTKGALVPRVALTATNSGSPITPAPGATEKGLVVYNTATAGASPNNVVPGFYYWDGTKWVSLSGGSGGNDWSLLGNAGTTAGTNFVGTTDAQDLAFKTNGTEKMRIMNAGNVGIGTAAPSQKLDVAGNIRAQGSFLASGTGQLELQLNNTGDPIDQKTTEFIQQTGVFTGRFVNDAYNVADNWLTVFRNTGTYSTKYVTFPAGNVGIGTTSPGQKLTVAGTTAYPGAVPMTTSDRPSVYVTGQFPNVIMASNGNNSHGSTLGFWNWDGTANTNQWNIGGGTSGNFSIGYAKNSTNPHSGINGYSNGTDFAFTALQILPSGNVGIGTTTPTNPLQVVSGSVNTPGDALNIATAQITGPNWAMDGGSSNGTFLVATNNAAAVDVGGSIGFAGRYSTTQQATFSAIKGASENGSYDGYLAFGTRTGAQIQERMRIKGNGNVGIGTAAPSTQLHTTGGVRFQNYTNGFLTVDGSGNLGVNAGGSSLFTAGTGLSWSGSTLNSNWTASGSNIYNNNSGNVGIGTSNPQEELEIYKSGGGAVQRFQSPGVVEYKMGIGTGENLFRIVNTNGGGGVPNNTAGIIINPAGNVGLGTSNPGNLLTLDGGGTEEIRSGGFLMMRPAANGWDMRLQAVSQRLDVLSGGNLATPIATFVDGGNVGIGTTSPSAKLDVAGQVKITGGSPGAGKVLTSDAAGLATWSTMTTAKAWVNFDGTTMAIRDSYGVASVVRTPGFPTGVYRVTFTTPFLNNGYVVSGTANVQNFAGPYFVIANNAGMGLLMTTALIDVGCRDNLANVYTDSNIVTLVIYGQQ